MCSKEPKDDIAALATSAPVEAAGVPGGSGRGSGGGAPGSPKWVSWRDEAGHLVMAELQQSQSSSSGAAATAGADRDDDDCVTITGVPCALCAPHISSVK